MDSLILSVIKEKFPIIAEIKLQQEIAEYGTIKDFEAGDIIMDYGSYIRSVPLVIKGSIKVTRENEKGNELFLYYLNAGDTCSMSFTCCMTQKKSDIKTIAEEDSTIILIPIKYVDLWMSQYPSWKNFILRSYDERMRQLVETIDSIAFSNMDERLLKYLRAKAKTNGSSLLKTTHQEIAVDLHASREGISRLLKKLEKQGALELGRNKIHLKD